VVLLKKNDPLFWLFVVSCGDFVVLFDPLFWLFVVLLKNGKNRLEMLVYNNNRRFTLKFVVLLLLKKIFFIFVNPKKILLKHHKIG
jgi:hypothetical protein